MERLPGSPHLDRRFNNNGMISVAPTSLENPSSEMQQNQRVNHSPYQMIRKRRQQADDTAKKLSVDSIKKTGFEMKLYFFPS